jgi:hypothetical protein
LSGSLLTWALYEEGLLTTWLRHDLDTLLRPYTTPVGTRRPPRSTRGAARPSSRRSTRRSTGESTPRNPPGSTGGTPRRHTDRSPTPRERPRH